MLSPPLPSHTCNAPFSTQHHLQCGFSLTLPPTYNALTMWSPPSPFTTYNAIFSTTCNVVFTLPSYLLIKRRSQRPTMRSPSPGPTRERGHTTPSAFYTPCGDCMPPKFACQLVSYCKFLDCKSITFSVPSSLDYSNYQQW